MPSTAPKRSRRLTFRARPHEAQIIQTAAEADRRTMSELVRGAALDRARRILAGPSDEEGGSDG